MIRTRRTSPTKRARTNGNGHSLPSTPLGTDVPLGDSITNTSNPTVSPLKQSRQWRRKRIRQQSPHLYYAFGGRKGRCFYLSILLVCGMGFFLSLRFALRHSDRPWRLKNASGALPSPVFERYSTNAPRCNANGRVGSLSPDEVSYTLVTQCSEDRLWMMGYHCQRWKHDVSLAVYTNRTRNAIQQTLHSFGCVDHQVTVQTIREEYSAQDFPVNALRNLAFSAVTTTHVVYVDIDFWQDTELYDRLHQAEVKSHLASNPKHALVLPAFALKRQCREYRDCRTNNLKRMPSTVKNVMSGITHSRTVSAFDPTNYGGHGSTRYADWMEYQAGPEEDGGVAETLLPIDCVVSNRYEPYLVVRYCHDLPPFQNAFTGYGKNKMTWVLQLRREGYLLHQLNSFVIHYPHLDSKARLAWNANGETADRPPMTRPRGSSSSEFLKYKRGRNDYTFVKFKEWLNSNVPDQTKVGLCEDHLDDDAKLWVNRHSTDVDEKGPDDESGSSGSEKSDAGDDEEDDGDQEQR